MGLLQAVGDVQLYDGYEGVLEEPAVVRDRVMVICAVEVKVVVAPVE